MNRSNSSLCAPYLSLKTCFSEMLLLSNSSQKAATGNETTSTDSLLSHIDLALWRTVPPVLLVFGTFGNVMTIVVMRGMRTGLSNPSMSQYFIALAVSDTFILFNDLLRQWLKYAFAIDIEPLHAATCKILRFASHTSAMTSAWFLIAMTYQRVISVLLPHRVGVICTARRGKLVIAGVVIFCSLMNAQFLYTFSRTTSPSAKTEYKCDVIPNKLAKYYINHVHSWIDLFFTSLFPFFFLMIGNGLLVNGLTKSMRQTLSMTVTASGHTRPQKNKVSSLTITLVLTSLAFLLLTSPNGVMDLYEESIKVNTFAGNEMLDPSFNEQLRLADTAGRLLWFTNSAVNFFLYCMKGKKFRTELRRRFCRNTQ